MSIRTIPPYVHIPDELAYQRIHLAESLRDIDARIILHRGSDPDWESKCRRSFEFLRRASSRRYSNNSLMRALNLSEWRVGTSQPEPFAVEVEVPYSFDPDTEVKSGGTLGIIFQLNDGTGRAMLAVAENARRKGVGRVLMRSHTNLLGVPSMWVSRMNRTGQQFLLSEGLIPQEFNANGAIRYGVDDEDDD